MKVVFLLVTLLLSLSLLSVRSHSYSIAEIKNEASVSIVAEDRGLISVTYGNGKKFTITNNIGKTIEIEGVELIESPAHEIVPTGENVPSAIEAGGKRVFNITGDPKSLKGKTIRIRAHWNGGGAEINSMIPDIGE